jgi:hypothetical protein
VKKIKTWRCLAIAKDVSRLSYVKKKSGKTLLAPQKEITESDMLLQDEHFKIPLFKGLVNNYKAKIIALQHIRN